MVLPLRSTAVRAVALCAGPALLVALIGAALLAAGTSAGSIAILTVAAIVFGVTAGSVLSRSQQRVVDDVRQTADAMGRGSFDAAVQHGEVAAPLQQMLTTMREQHGELTRTQREYDGLMAALDRSQAVIEFTLDGHILQANDNFLAALGYSLSEIRGQHHSMFVEPAVRDSVEYRQFWERLGRGEYDAGQYKRVGKNGREIWIQASYNPVLDEHGKPWKVVKYATDITAQKAKAADYEGQLAAIDKAQAVIEFTLDGHIVQANENFLKTLGYRLDEIRGQHHSMFVTAAERDSETYRHFWEKLGRGEYDAGRYRRVGKEGREVWIQASYNPILDASGRPMKVVKYASDITAEVEAAARLQQVVEATQTVVVAARGGDLTQRLPTDGQSGTVLSLCETINALLDDVKATRDRDLERAAADKKLADENLRIRNALDNVNTNVMIANNDRQIIYLNQSIVQMLGKAEAEIRSDLPSFDVRKLLGGSIDQFHRAPEHQQRMLASLRDTHRAQIKVGGRTFALTVNPIINADGERLGSVVEWLDRTEEVAVEAEVSSIVRAAADGDFGRRVSIDGKQGFFLQLAENINRLLETSDAGLRELARVFDALAHGDLTQRIDAEFRGTFGQLKDDANTTVAQLTEIVSQIKSATDTINTAAREIAAGNSDLSSRTEEQAASLEETASSMEELTSTVKQNAQNAYQANQLAIGASDVAVKGGAVVAEVVATMSSISESSKKIADIIGVIDGIAFQTNILALNAAVEAARAGEQGRGFAVVAGEVRNLAQRSASAAKEIKALIGDAAGRVDNGAKLVEQAGRTMDEIVVSVKRVTDIMGEITSASQEQSQGIEQINQTVTQMDEVTQQNAALVEEASASARALEEQAGGLAESVSRFKLGGDTSKPAAVAQAAESNRRPAATKPRAAAAPPRNAGREPRVNGATSGDVWTEF
ncbi:methyl-accepting chemotaxis protein [Solimonas marina]|uniref:PAS domain S-box protein n=1 Tax=Solimonas marina TaxID=2714601 RepID=A0A970B7Y4_9GAMM|nr:methyl-accepting chemotaxis protein [Solimonas marina]NKF21714.1 PAS domain S-box protein [Solimonas marina]